MLISKIRSVVAGLFASLLILTPVVAQSLPSTPPQAFRKLSPTSGQTVAGPNVTFTWSPTTGPVVICVSATNGVCPNGAAGYSPTSGNSTTMKLAPGTWYFQLRALYSGGYVAADGVGSWTKFIVSPPKNQPPIGYVDGIDKNGRISGWAYDPDTPSVSISIHMYLDGIAGGGGILQGAVLANVSRADVNTAMKVTGQHGFSFPLPSTLSLRHKSTLHFYAIDSAGGANTLLTPTVSVGKNTNWYDSLLKIRCGFTSDGGITCGF